MYKKALLALALVGAVASAQADVLLSEDFNNINSLPGWAMTNQSTPTGTIGWFQGNSGIFASQSGADNSYIGASYNNAAAGGTISNWLITSTFSTELAGVISFWAKRDVGFDDSFSFGLSNGSTNTVDFSLGSLEIANTDWTMYTLNFAKQGVGTLGRFAINYSGDADSSNYIGFDTLAVNSVPVAAVPEPSIWVMLATGLLGLLALRRRQKNS